MKKIIRQVLYLLLENEFMKFIYKIHMSFYSRMYERIGELRSIYYRGVLASCGENLTIYGKPIIYQPSKIFIGKNFTINNGAQISPRGQIFIGDNVTMSRGSQITAGSLDTSNWVDSDNLGNWISKKHIAKDVYIADGCWLCVNSIILPGVSIKGRGVIVSAGAVVTKDIIEDFVIVGGVPARIIKRLKQ